MDNLRKPHIHKPDILVVGSASCLLIALIGTSVSLGPTEGRSRNEALYAATSYKLDPPIGTVIRGLEPEHLNLPKGTPGETIVVVAMGGCGACSAHAFNPALLEGAKNAPKVAVFEGFDAPHTEDVKRLISRFDSVVRLNSADYRRLNAAWGYRLMALDRLGHVQALQKLGESSDDFYRRALP